MAPRQRRLDLRLGLAQEIERAVEVVLAHLAQPQHRPQRVGRRGGVEVAGGRQLGRRCQHPRHDQRQRQGRQALRAPGQELGQAELPRQPEHRGDMAMGQRAQDLQPLRRRPQALALEHPLQGLDLGLGPARQVGKGAGPHLAALAPALAQQDGGG
jgi:hypothetical protein